MKVLPHSAHSYGRSPLWMRSCCSRLEVRVKALLTCHTHTAPGLGGALGQEPEAKPHGTSPICCCSWGLRSSSATCPWSCRASAALQAKGLTTWACARQPH